MKTPVLKAQVTSCSLQHLLPPGGVSWSGSWEVALLESGCDARNPVGLDFLLI